MDGLGLIQQERMAAIEDRRKILQRKNIGDVYRKNLLYTQLKKNPVLSELENLLLGYKELDLYKKHKEESKEMAPQEQLTIRELSQAKKNVRAHELTQKAMDGDEYSGISYDNEDSIPERFSKKLKLDPFADTIFGRSYEELYQERLFKKAIATYTIHSEMAKNGYRPGNEPTFSMTA